MRRALASGGVYIGSILGAGFSSGQELLRFFAVFGQDGLWGIVVAAGMFGVLGFVILERAHRMQTPSHRELLNALCGTTLGSFIDIVLNIFVFGAIGVMLAATGTLLHNFYGLPFLVGLVGMAALTREIVRHNPGRFLDLNGILVFALLLITVVLLVPVLRQTPMNLPNISNRVASLGMIPTSWFMGAVLYVSFNLTLSISPLGALGKQIGSTRSAIVGSTLAAVALGATGFMLVIAMLHHQPAIVAHELPILAILTWYNPAFGPLYAIALLLAILTSCVGGAYGLGNRLKPHLKPSSRIPEWIPFFAIPIAFVGFDNLVQTLYPIVGYVGLGVTLMGLLPRGAFVRSKRH